MAIGNEIGPSVYIGLGAVALAALVFAFPPIISREGGRDQSSAERAVAKDQQAYCRENMQGVNCACFAGKATHILTQDQPEITGFTYMDRDTLARGQASRRC